MTMTPTQAPSVAFQACMDEMSRLSPFLIDRWASRLGIAMYERSLNAANPAKRDQLQDAIGFLKKYQPIVEQGFLERVTQTIGEDMSFATSSEKSFKSARPLSSVRFDDLELMGDKQVQQAVESARLHQLVRLGCESAFSGFSARFSTAQGFLTVKSDINPLRPEIMASALNEVLRSLPISTQTRAYWLLDGAPIMGEELQSLYMSLNDFLADLGIEPAAYEVIGTPLAKASGTTASRPMPLEPLDDSQVVVTSPAQTNSQFVDTRSDQTPESAAHKPLLTLDHLHHLLMGNYDYSSQNVFSFSQFSADEMVRQDFSHTVPTALDALSELEQLGIVGSPMTLTRPAPPTPVAKLRARFKTNAKTLGQSLAIEVVGLMIEQIANDERLLPPVRQIVANAEPAFLQLAVTDPRFFSQKSHPARRLLDVVTSTSLGYADESAPGFPEFFQHLQVLAASLAANPVNDSSHFAKLLQEFEGQQNRNTPENRKAQRLAVQALLQAEKRNLIAVKIASEIRARPDFIDCNRIITAFLTGPWAQVMARERLSEQGVTLGDSLSVFSLALGDLLWSLDAGQVPSHRPRLVKMIPGLLQSLSKGLASINFPIEQARPFFDELMALHHEALKTLNDTPADTPKSSHSLERMFVRNDESDLMPLWLAPSEVEHSGFMQDPDEPALELLAGNPLEPQDPASARLSSQNGLNGSMELNLGDWVDLLVEMQWLRAQLTWVNPENTLFMFTSYGGRKHSMTSRVLRHLAKLELVKVVSRRGVLEGALDSVARTAMLNSMLEKAQP